ncbi:MAG TPA: hypothetical protein VMU88_05800 [bacterium]|nr:hypothetical protein [bacterium]
MSRSRLSIYFFSLGLWAGTAWGAAAQTPLPAFQAIPDSQGEAWARSIKAFEQTVAEQAQSLSKVRERRDQLHAGIEKLEVKATALRNANSPNLFDQLKLKKTLGDLQDQLESEAALNQEWQRDLEGFEQKSLSLLSLYNEEINRQMDEPEAGSSAQRLNDLIGLVRKREALRRLIDRFPEVSAGEKLPPLSLLEKSGERDWASLNTTLDILRQREKELVQKIEKADLRSAELNQEITLQSKMRDLLSDVRKMNEDSSFPRESLNRGDLQALESKTQDSDFRGEIESVEKQKEADEADLAQVRQAIQGVQAKIQSSQKGGSK